MPHSLLAMQSCLGRKKRRGLISPCYADRDRLRILQSIRLPARSVSLFLEGLPVKSFAVSEEYQTGLFRMAARDFMLCAMIQSPGCRFDAMDSWLQKSTASSSAGVTVAPSYDRSMKEF